MSREETASAAHTLTWFKSSYSGGEGGECVEVAASPAAIHVRDSKIEQGPLLSFSTSGWARFVALAGRD